MSTKALLRARALELRTAIDHSDRRELSERAAARVLSLPGLQGARVIGAYAARDDEISARRIIEWCWRTQRVVALPRVRKAKQSDAPGALEFWQITAEEQLEAGRFGIREPSPSVTRESHLELSAQKLDAVIVPGVAFDQNGGRIGFGKGHYDRFLSQATRATLRIGLAFDCQVFPLVPQEPHDIRLTHVVTPTSSFEVTC